MIATAKEAIGSWVKAVLAARKDAVDADEGSWMYAAGRSKWRCYVVRR